MPKPKSDPPRGVLNYKEASGNFGLFRFHPGAELKYFIEHYWIVRWDLRGKEPFCQDVLSHPSVHLVFEAGNTQIWGVVSGKFTRKLEGAGQVMGVKFRPGAFYPFCRFPVSEFTDRKLPFSAVFEDDLNALESDILSAPDNNRMIKCTEAFLMKYIPEKDPNVQEINRIVETIMEEKSIIKVDDVMNRFAINKRTLQRLFKKYVGVSPKWIIQRYRLHEAAEKMVERKAENWSRLALDLGYFDQSHFIRDFKTIIGQTPGEYLESLQ